MVPTANDIDWCKPRSPRLRRWSSTGALAGLVFLFTPPQTGWAAHHRPIRPGQSTAAASEVTAAPVTVAVLGDGFAEALADGLGRDLAGSGMIIQQVTHAPYGLAEPARFDWAAAVKTLLDGGSHIDAAVIMLGANDLVAMPDGSASAEPRTPRWRVLYGNAVQSVAELFRAKGIPLTWVGLPIVEDQQASAGFVALNEIVRDRAVRAGATYVDSWDAFADEGGQYNAFGPDLNGRITRLRTGDGFDFTRAGTSKLASFVDIDPDKLRAGKPDPAPSGDVALSPQPGFDSALDIDVTAQIRREAGLPALPSAGSGAGSRAAAGPVITITSPALAPDGRLVASTADPAPLTGAGGGSLAQRSLVEGQPIQPKIGRIDDFSWPRP